DGAHGQRRFHFRAERGFPWGDVQRRVDVAAVHAKPRMRLEVDLEKEIPRLALPDARGPLSGKSEHLAFQDALGDPHIDVWLLHCDVALPVDRRDPQRDHTRGALIGVLEVDEDPRVVIFAARIEPRTATPRPSAAEELGEEVAEVRALPAAELPSRELESRVP